MTPSPPNDVQELISRLDELATINFGSPTAGRANEAMREAAATLTALSARNAVLEKALGVYGRWAIEVSDLGELATLEADMAEAGVSLQQLGEWIADPSQPPAETKL